MNMKYLIYPYSNLIYHTSRNQFWRRYSGYFQPRSHERFSSESNRLQDQDPNQDQYSKIKLTNLKYFSNTRYSSFIAIAVIVIGCLFPHPNASIKTEEERKKVEEDQSKQSSTDVESTSTSSSSSSSSSSNSVPTLSLLFSRWNPNSTPPPTHKPTPESDKLPPLKYPVVLVHGFLGYTWLGTSPFSKQPVLEYFGDVRRMYESSGYTVVTPLLPKSWRVAQRAEALAVALGITPTEQKEKGEAAGTSGGGEVKEQIPQDKETKKNMQEMKGETKEKQSEEKQDINTADRRNSADKGTASSKSSSIDNKTQDTIDEKSGGISVVTSGNIDLSRYKGKFHVIAHSMGGLDSRYLIRHLQPFDNNRIISLTTLSSPHRGSPIADLLVTTVQKKRKVFPLPNFNSVFSDSLPSLPSEYNNYVRDSKENDTNSSHSFAIENFVNYFSQTFNLDFRGTIDLTTNSCAKFNESTPNHPSTKYFSYPAYRSFTPTSIWYSTSRLIAESEGWNDGLVSVSSGSWGEVQGILEMDHLEMVGLGLGRSVRYILLFKQ